MTLKNIFPPNILPPDFPACCHVDRALHGPRGHVAGLPLLRQPLRVVLPRRVHGTDDQSRRHHLRLPLLGHRTVHRGGGQAPAYTLNNARHSTSSTSGVRGSLTFVFQVIFRALDPAFKIEDPYSLRIQSELPSSFNTYRLNKTFKTIIKCGYKMK